MATRFYGIFDSKDKLIVEKTDSCVDGYCPIIFTNKRVAIASKLEEENETVREVIISVKE